MGVIRVQRSKLEQLNNRIAERIAQRLFEQVTNTTVSKPKHGAATRAAYAIAAAVHLVTLGSFVLSIWLIFFLGGFGYIVVGIGLLAFALLLRPRFGRVPKDAVVIDPASAPRLYELVGRVAGQLDARPVWRIVLEANFNAGFAQVGLRRRRVLILGYACWNLLGPDERVAMLGHELGHSVNGDGRRGLLVNSSLRSLWEIYRLLRTLGRHVPEANLVMVLVGIIAGVLGWLASWPVLGLLMIQERLLAQTTQRAEYYADQLAVRAAGSRAIMSTLDSLRFREPCMRELETSVIRRDPDIWVATRRWYAALTEEQRAKLIERAETERHRLDSTHPPTAMRIAAIGSRPEVAGAITSSQAEADAIDAELQPLLRSATEDIRAAAIG